MKKNEKKFRNPKFIWLTRDDVKVYDQEVIIWITKGPPSKNPKTGLYSRRRITAEGIDLNFEFTVIDLDLFENIYGMTLKPGERIKVKIKVEILP